MMGVVAVRREVLVEPTSCKPIGVCTHMCLRKKKKKGFPGGSVIKSLPVNAGDAGLIPGPGRLHTSQSN